MELSLTSNVGSNGAGVMAGSISNLPSAYSEWASFAGLYDECRVLAMTAKWIPNYNGSFAAGLVQSPLVTFWDRDSGGSIASFALGFNFGSAEVGMLGSPTPIRSIKMIGSEDAAFVNTTAPIATWYFRFFSGGLTINTTYGYIVTKILVQFRGRL